MFQIKDFVSIAASMMNYAKATQKQLTDFTVGSVVRTLLESSAIEIEELYQQMWLGLKEAIPTAVYNGFGFAKLPSTAAQGVVSATFGPGPTLTITAGTRFVTGASGYLAISDIAVSSGTVTVSIPVAAETPGIAAPVLQNDVFTAALPRLTGAIAYADFQPGQDAEDEAARKRRFIDYIKNIARSPVAAVEYGLTTVVLRDGNGTIVESVKFAAVEERFMTNPAEPAGIIYCYIHNGVNGASSELIAEATKILNGYVDAKGNKVVGWKAAGVKATVAAAGNTSVNVVAAVVVADDYDADAVVDNVKAAIVAYLSAAKLGAQVLRAEIIAAAMLVDGVFNFTLTAPVADVAPSAYQKAVPGLFTLTHG